MTYSVKEIFYTLQGEGANAGRPAVFCRFSGCNLWTGRETDRARATCQFCDTDFVGTDGPGGGRFGSSGLLADAIVEKWPQKIESGPFIVLTGGEPLLQVDEELIADLHLRGCRVAIETNGTIAAPAGIDWICVSPKAGAPIVQASGQELKLVFPQDGVKPSDFIGLPFQHHFLSPKDGPLLGAHTKSCVEYCLSDPRWRLSIQTHKILNIP